MSKKVVQEIGNGLTAKVIGLTNSSFYGLLSFTCLSLTAIRNFVYQATYIITKILQFLIRSSHDIVQQDILCFFSFVVYSLSSRGLGVFFLFADIYHSQSILLRVKSIIFLFDFLSFTVYILASQECFCLMIFVVCCCCL